METFQWLISISNREAVDVFWGCKHTGLSTWIITVLGLVSSLAANASSQHQGWGRREAGSRRWWQSSDAHGGWMETCSRNGCPKERGGRATEDGVGPRKKMGVGVGGSKR